MMPTLRIKRTALSGLLLIGAIGCPTQDRPPVSGTSTASSTRGDSAVDPVKAGAQPSTPSSLLDRIQVELRKVKPDVVSTRLVSLVPGPGWGDTMAYAVIAKGTGPHRGWRRIEDVGEIFGVFWVDSTLTRPSAAVDVFPSRRLRDYDVWLQRAWGSSVVVCAEGGSYGDGQMRREIQTEPDSHGVRKITVDTSLDASLSKKGDSNCGSSSPKGD